MRKKFKVFYPQDHRDPELQGKRYKPPSNRMLVMNAQGIFFLYCSEQYYPYIDKLSDVIGNYDIVWND